MDDKYAVLINSIRGASHQTVTCKEFNKSNFYVIDNFDLIDKSIVGGQTIGIAFPMADGTFKVSRFSLSGASQAVQGMVARLKAVRQPPSAIRDTRM